MNIYIDFDDTIESYIENVVRIVNKRYNRNVKHKDIGMWDFSDVYPDIPLENIIGVFGEKEFFKTLKLKDDVIPTLRRYTKYNHLIIVSKVDGIAIKEKYDWIKEHLIDIGIDIEFRGIPLGKSKGIIDMADGIMIDDNAQFLKETNAKYKILYKCDRAFDDTQDWDGDRVSSWKELNKLLHNIISQEKGHTNGKI